MKRNNFVLIFGLLCLAFSVKAQNTIEDSISAGGLMRKYRIYVPTAYDGTQPWPLVLNLHGYTSNSLEQLFYSNFQPIADTAHFLMVLPDGTEDFNGDPFWNAGFGAAVDDVGFLNALIDSVSAAYNVDAQRVYSTGMSNGGYMSYTLACELSNRIAAIASVTGSMTLTQYLSCVPSRPIPVMQIHGTADPTVPYAGNALTQGIEDVVAFWVNHNQCPVPATMTPVPNINLADGCTAERYDYAPGNDGARVVFYKVIGGGHTWPGSGFIIGVTNQDFNASLEIWRFFAQYTLSGPVGVQTNAAPVAVSAYPNPTSGMLALELPQGTTQVRVFAATGQWMANAPLQNTIDLSALPNGLYFVEMRAETGVFRVPVMLQR